SDVCSSDLSGNPPPILIYRRPQAPHRPEEEVPSSMRSPSFCRTVLLASILSLVGLTAVAAAQEAHRPHWAYEGKEGPKEWGNLDASYAACSIGHTQSPIDIKDARKADLPTLKFDYHAVPLNIIDNGHTIQVNYAPGSTLDRKSVV